MTSKNNLKFLLTAIAFVLMLTGAILWTVRYRQASDDRVSSADSPAGTALISDEARIHGVSLKTNSWFSSAYKKFPTAPMFVLPGAYRFDEAGLSFGIPSVVSTENTIFGSFDPICSIGMRSVTTQAAVERYGDWDASFLIQSGAAPWKVHMTQGSPVVSIESFEGPLVLTCSDGVEKTPIEHGIALKKGSAMIIVQGKGAFSADTDPISSKATLLLSAEKTYRIILIPQETDQPVSFFAGLPWNRIVDTYVDYRHADGKIIADHLFSFSRENDETILTTLWPHHRSGMGADVTDAIGTYRTSIGDLRLVRTNGFSVTYDDPDFSFSFDPVSDQSVKAKIQEKIREDAKRLSKETPPAGVYFRGAWLGGLASVAQLASVYGAETEQDRVLDILEKELLGSLENFVYDEQSFMLVARNTEFGNDQGNDHHFHYGYYLRAASVLVSLRPELRSRIEPIINQLALDIATTDRSSTRYPYVRNFAPYDGHSWADGFALFADGNNQESTSEALNAWYGLWMWGEATGNDTFRKTGAELFSVELAATKAYWFGKDNPFPAGYAHAMASLVWGGKRDYATWFSGQAMHIHGIQWLPITPASDYLATMPHAAERKQELLRQHPEPATHEWGDLYAAYLSFTDPQEAKAIIKSAEDKQAIKSKALLYQTVYRNAELRR